MREIKLRAWAKEYKKYCVDVEYIDGTWIGYVRTRNGYTSTEDVIIEQSTGLKDKNGKEICDGDILKGEMGTFELKWYSEVAQYMFRPNMEMKWHPSFNESQAKYMEVIGNVHENPELFK